MLWAGVRLWSDQVDEQMALQGSEWVIKGKASDPKNNLECECILA